MLDGIQKIQEIQEIQDFLDAGGNPENPENPGFSGCWGESRNLRNRPNIQENVGCSMCVTLHKIGVTLCSIGVTLKGNRAPRGLG